MPSSTDSERRQYYRVEDVVGLEYRRVDSDLHSPVATLFEGSETLVLQEEVRRIDADIRAQISQLAETDRNLAHLLKSLNEKLDTVSRIMTFERKPLQDEQWRQVTLSEGGLSFECNESGFQPDTVLAVRLTLNPELTRLSLLARIVDVEPSDRGERLHLEFTDMQDNERQQIAKHVLRIQARERQQQRQHDDMKR